MKYLWLVLFGLVGGVLGGMGMGGGTLLIPLLTIGVNIPQQIAQSINLIAFLPMSIFALIIHSKNHLVKFKLGLPIIISGVVSAIIGAIIATQIESKDLSFWFGIFLIVVGVFQICSLFVFHKKKKGVNEK